jgi:hypothetical protein
MCAAKGFAAFPHDFWPLAIKINPTGVCIGLIGILWDRSVGRGHAPGEKPDEWMAPTRVVELAEVCQCDVRTIERELAGLQKRKVAEVKKEGKGIVSVRLLYKSWKTLPKYKPPVVDISTGEETEVESEGETKANDPTRVELTKKPVTVRAGEVSRPITVNVGIKTLVFRSIGQDAIFSPPLVEGGKLLIDVRVSEEWLNRDASRRAQLNGTNKLTSGTRHSRRDGVGEQVAKSEQVANKKANELAAIFDPLLKRSQSRLLSADSSALAAACAEYHGLSKDDLLHFLVGGSDPRAGRPISSPKSCVAIIKEARLNWEKSGSVPDVSLPSKAGKIPEDRTMAFLAKERAKRRRENGHEE